MTALKEKLREAVEKEQKRDPVWKGPEVDGVTQSLLSRFLVCKERFRLLVIEGWKPNEGFSAPLEYGQMWHVCEEALAAKLYPGAHLKRHCQKLCEKYQTEQQQIEKWYQVCLRQFPIYTEFWSKHPDVKDRTPLLQEQVFNVPYTLPSGRVVKLRGKWDSVDLIGKSKSAGIYLQENKTKGRIDEEYLAKQLTFDIQTMIYLIALLEFRTDDDMIPHDIPIKGIRYNIVRRTERRQKKGSKNVPAESAEEFGVRCGLDFTEDPEHWFMRWTVEITPGDIQRFKDKFLDSCLEELCDWYNLITGAPKHKPVPHYRLPYGVYNSVMEGRGSDIEEYLLSGSTTGLKRVDNLFPELE